MCLDLEQLIMAKRILLEVKGRELHTSAYTDYYFIVFSLEYGDRLFTSKTKSFRSVLPAQVAKSVSWHEIKGGTWR